VSRSEPNRRAEVTLIAISSTVTMIIVALRAATAPISSRVPATRIPGTIHELVLGELALEELFLEGMFLDMTASLQRRLKTGRSCARGFCR
jgi:hypothetical protein